MPISATAGAPTWSAFTSDISSKVIKHYAAFELAEAADSALSIIRAVDVLINETQPFKLAKDPTKLPEVARILSACAEGVRIASVLLTPIMPTKCAEVLAAFGATTTEEAATNGIESSARWGGLQPGTKILKCAPFMRVDAPV